MEFMSHYDAKIVYVKGEDNTLADALSCLPADAQEQLENMVANAYAYCPDDAEEDVITAVVPTSGDTAYSLASALAGLGSLKILNNEVCMTLVITADKDLLEQI